MTVTVRTSEIKHMTQELLHDLSKEATILNGVHAVAARILLSPKYKTRYLWLSRVYVGAGNSIMQLEVKYEHLGDVMFRKVYE